MIQAKRISDPTVPEDGLRVLATRYRPRFVKKGEEPWDRWDKRLAPSVELLDAFLGRRREGRRVVESGLEPIPWSQFSRRYAKELEGEVGQAARTEYAGLARSGQALTFLCYCEDPNRCHRTLWVAALQELLAE